MITLDELYSALPSAGAAHTPTKGRALDGAWALTMVRNANYIAAVGRAPVVMTGYGWTDPDGTLKLGMPRVALSAEAEGAAGTVRIYAGRSPWLADAPNLDDIYVDLPVTAVSLTAHYLDLGVVPVSDDRIVYLYFMTRYVHIETWCVVAQVFDG
jgi:hypothetical protein